MDKETERARDVDGILHFLTPKQMAEEIVRMDTVLASRALPEGFRLLPVEATDSMTGADWDVSMSDAHSDGGVSAAAWRAMVEAAPQVTHGNGHSGLGWYMHDTEYPEEGAVFLSASPAPTAAPEAPTKDTTADQLLHALFEVCESIEDIEPKNDFQRGQRFAAKSIRNGVGTWFQDTFCGRSFMGDPVIESAASSETAAFPAHEWLKAHERLADDLVTWAYCQRPNAYGSKHTIHAQNLPDHIARADRGFTQARAALFAHARLRLPEGSEPVATMYVGSQATRDGFRIVWHKQIPDGEHALYTHPIAQAGDATNAADGVAASGPLRELGAYLARVLDEDQWAHAEALLLKVAPRAILAAAKQPKQPKQPQVHLAANGHQAPCGSNAADGARVGATDQGEKA